MEFDYEHMYDSILRRDLTEPEIIFHDCLYNPFNAFRRVKVLHFDPKVYTTFFKAMGISDPALDDCCRNKPITDQYEIRRHFPIVQRLHQKLIASNPDWNKVLEVTLRGDIRATMYAEEVFDKLYPKDRRWCEKEPKPL